MQRNQSVVLAYWKLITWVTLYYIKGCLLIQLKYRAYLTGHCQIQLKHYGGSLGWLDITGSLLKTMVLSQDLCRSYYKKNNFHWTMESEETFNLLKEALSKPPVLALPDFSKDFVIECDACGVGIGAILMQQGRPIAYFSQALKGSALSLSTYEKEMLALVKSVQKWRPYLLGKLFLVRTDQRSLKYLLEQRIITPY